MSTILQRRSHKVYCCVWSRWFSPTTFKGTLKKDSRGFNYEDRLGKGGKPYGLFTKQGMMLAKRKLERVPLSPHIELVYHNNSTELYLRPTTFMMIPFISTFAYIRFFDSGFGLMVRKFSSITINLLLFSYLRFVGN